MVLQSTKGECISKQILFWIAVAMICPIMIHHYPAIFPNIKVKKMQKVVTVRWSDSVNFLLVIEIFLFKVVLK